MRELTVRMRFLTPCLGSVRRDDNRFYLPRNPAGMVAFRPTWHQSNMRFASKALGRHCKAVDLIRWDAAVDGAVGKNPWFRRYFDASASGKRRYALHEAFQAGQVIGVHCMVPEAIDDADFQRLLERAGRYCGISPFGAGEYGFFDVAEILPRYVPQPET